MFVQGCRICLLVRTKESQSLEQEPGIQEDNPSNNYLFYDTQKEIVHRY